MANEEWKKREERFSKVFNLDEGVERAKTIKILAKVVLWVGLGLTFLAGIPLVFLYGIGFLVMICGGILFPLIFLFMSAFGILVEKISIIEQRLKLESSTKNIVLIEAHQFNVLDKKITEIEQHLNKDDEKKE